jgi:hypothetical protein
MHQLKEAWLLNANHLGGEPNGATWEFFCKGFQQQLPIYTSNFMVSSWDHSQQLLEHTH